MSTIGIGLYTVLQWILNKIESVTGILGKNGLNLEKYKRYIHIKVNFYDMLYKIRKWDGRLMFIPLDEEAEKLSIKKIEEILSNCKKNDICKTYQKDIKDLPCIDTIERKNKKRNYSKVFKFKSKILLKTARLGSGCTDCGTVHLLQVHHIDENIENNHDNNLQVLCFYCHAKHHKHMQNRLPPIWLK